MSITLTLTVAPAGTAVSQYHVMRGTDGVEPTLQATLPSETESWTDPSSQVNTLYFYRIDTELVDGQTIPGSLQPIVDMADTGPGPAAIAHGDWLFGFFGVVDEADVITLTDFNSEVPSIIGLGNYGATNFHWLKFAIEGEVVFIPSDPIRRGTGGSLLALLNGLYQIGCLYNTDGALINGAKWAGITVPNTVQHRVISSGPYEYKVATISGSRKRISTFVNTEGLNPWVMGGAISAFALRYVTYTVSDEEVKDLRLAYLYRPAAPDSLANTANFITPYTANAPANGNINVISFSLYTRSNVAGGTTASAAYFWVPMLTLKKT